MLGSVQNVDLKLLRVFQAVARSGGFTAAQSELNTSQSTISTCITQLEQRLGLRLCERGIKGFRLTSEGTLVLNAADRLFGALEEFRIEVAVARGNLAGGLQVGIADNLVTSSRFLLPQAIAEVGAASSQVTFQVRVAAPLEMEAMLRDGRLDCGVGLFSRHLPDLTYELLYNENHELYCGDEHRLFNRAESDIQDSDLASTAYAGRGYLEGIPSLQPPIPLSGDSGSHHIEGLIALVLSGRFIAYLPTHSAERWVHAGKMRSIQPQRMARIATIECAYRPSALRMRPIQLFRQALERLYAPA